MRSVEPYATSCLGNSGIDLQRVVALFGGLPFVKSGFGPANIARLPDLLSIKSGRADQANARSNLWHT
jgi:hypothetical protein